MKFMENKNCHELLRRREELEAKMPKIKKNFFFAKIRIFSFISSEEIEELEDIKHKIAEECEGYLLELQKNKW